MAGVLRFVSRRSRSLPPALEGKLPRQDALKAVDAMAPDQRVFQRQAMTSKGFSPSFISLAYRHASVRNTKVGVDLGLLRRGFFTSSRPPQEKYWFEIVGHRVGNPNSPNTRIYRKRIAGVSKDEAEAMLRTFLWRVKSDGKVFPDGVPSLTMYQKILLLYGKVKLVGLDHASVLKTRYLMKFVSLEILLATVFLYAYFARPLNFIRRLWDFLKSWNEKKPEQKH